MAVKILSVDDESDLELLLTQYCCSLNTSEERFARENMSSLLPITD